MARVARSIRLPRALWAALDQAALDASSRSSGYRSANAMLEEILQAQLDRRQADRSASSLDLVRAARSAKRDQDRERVRRHLDFIEALARAGSRQRKAALEEAARSIERWRREGLASPIYIAAWTKLVAAGVPAIARALRLGHDSLSPEALTANSPFAVSASPQDAIKGGREAA
jgi:hypothetical protein